MQLKSGCLRAGKAVLLSDRELITSMLIIIRPAKRIRNGAISSVPVVALLAVTQKTNSASPVRYEFLSAEMLKARRPGQGNSLMFKGFCCLLKFLFGLFTIYWVLVFIAGDRNQTESGTPKFARLYIIIRIHLFFEHLIIPERPTYQAELL